MTKTGQRRGETSPVTGTGTRVSANDHCGTGGGQKSTSSSVKNESEPDGPRSGLKTTTGTAETILGKRESVKGPDESALAHETANGSWSESETCEAGHATQQTASRHDGAPPRTPCHVTGRPRKSESRSGPQPLETRSAKAEKSTEGGAERANTVDS